MSSGARTRITALGASALAIPALDPDGILTVISGGRAGTGTLDFCGVPTAGAAGRRRTSSGPQRDDA